MIANRNIYKEYLLHECGSKSFIYSYLSSYFQLKPINRFLLLLRTSEYYKNCKKGLFYKIILFIVKYQKYKLGLKLGFTIPENVAKKGLQLPHYGTIVINANTRIGENCRIHACTNIGTSGGGNKAPIIGNNVYIGPGAKIYGGIEIADNVSIAANAAVSKSFLEKNVILGGVPAKVISKMRPEGGTK